MMLHDERESFCAGQCGGSSLCDCYSELAAFDSQHSSQVVLSPELSQIRCSLATNINHNHDPIIRLLPFELASKVFIFCVEDCVDESFSQLQDPSLKLALKMPLNLGKICRAWREIAWATLQLWKTMTLFVDNLPQMITIDLVGQWLSRSGQQPLFITIILQEFPEMLEDVDESIPPLFGVIREHSYRWRRMQLFVPPNQLEILLGGIDSLPLLESLNILPSFQSGQDLEGQGFQLVNTPLLARVEFYHLFLQDISLEWTNLTFVGFTCVHLGEIFQILRLATVLTGCKFVTICDGNGDYPITILTHQSLKTLHIQPEGDRFFPDMDPLFSKAIFPSLVDFTYDASASEDQFPLNGLLDLFDRSRCSITHFTLILHENGASMDEQDIVLLLNKLPTVTHLSLLNFDKDIRLVTNHFLGCFAETGQTNADIFLPQLQVLKYEGWRSFAWKDLADMCYSRSTPSSLGSDHDASNHIPIYTPLRCLEFKLYLPDGNVQNHDYIDLDCLPVFKQARGFGTTITIHCNVSTEGDVDGWEMIDSLQFA